MLWLILATTCHICHLLNFYWTRKSFKGISTIDTWLKIWWDGQWQGIKINHILRSATRSLVSRHSMCIILSSQNLNLGKCWIKHLGAGWKNRRARINSLQPLSMALTRQLVQCTISSTPVIWNGHSGLRELTNVPYPRSCGLGKVCLHILLASETSDSCSLTLRDSITPIFYSILWFSGSNWFKLVQ